MLRTSLSPVNVAEALERTANPIIGHILNNLYESQTLAAQRNALLPKLVLGKLPVTHTEMKIP